MTRCNLTYDPLLQWTDDEIRAILEQGDVNQLLYVPLVVAMYPSSRVHAEQICLRLATHIDANVRGNTMEGFGHIARIFRALNKRLVEPIVEAGMADDNDWVRGKAEDAADEIERFCGWVFRGREDRLLRPTCPRLDC